MSTLLEKLSEKQSMKPESQQNMGTSCLHCPHANIHRGMGVWSWLQKKWNKLGEDNMTDEEFLKEFCLEDETENPEDESKESCDWDEVEDGDYTDEMVIDELKDDLFHMYVLLEMENILMNMFLHDSFDMEEKLQEASNVFNSMAGDIYTKWERMFGADLKGRR